MGKDEGRDPSQAPTRRTSSTVVKHASCWESLRSGAVRGRSGMQPIPVSTVILLKAAVPNEPESVRSNANIF